jgi:L-glutamine---4-(methylsulfanyl)-2-oxobutanoate aminotransferase
VQGICDILAKAMKQNLGLDVDPLTDFVICCGQSEAFAAAIFASSTTN